MKRTNKMNKVLHREDLGMVEFGVFKGKKWSEIPKNYLEYIQSPECLTSSNNKEKAKKELYNRTFLDGQIELF